MKTRLVCHHDEQEYGHVEVTTSAVTWREIADEFCNFLKGCGFQITAQDLAEHYYTPDITDREGREL